MSGVIIRPKILSRTLLLETDRYRLVYQDARDDHASPQYHATLVLERRAQDALGGAIWAEASTTRFDLMECNPTVLAALWEAYLRARRDLDRLKPLASCPECHVDLACALCGWEGRQ